MGSAPLPDPVPDTMAAMVLTGHGGIDKLVYRQDVPTPRPGPGEVLVQVTATAKNNTDRKAREGLYPTKEKGEVTSFAMGGEPTLTFPRIQGADVAGRVVAVGEGVDGGRIGERGLLDFNLYADARRDINLTPDYYGHGADGGFAEYVAVPSDQFHHVPNPELADAELASMGMCSYQTAYHMMTSARVTAGERVLVTGASGGVGTALIQLCRIVGAVPYAVSQPDKADALLALGAEAVIDRGDLPTFVERVLAATDGAPIDAVMDLVGDDRPLHRHHDHRHEGPHHLPAALHRRGQRRQRERGHVDAHLPLPGAALRRLPRHSRGGRATRRLDPQRRAEAGAACGLQALRPARGGALLRQPWQQLPGQDRDCP